ncbi:MAG TPA: TonB-dependent receptor [Thermoanaerobaculia bacterium]|nr:TonB-dependent receptor [Thermoanaerobaculia bacterium]
MKKLRGLQRWLALVLLLLPAVPSVHAQGTTGTLTGTVTHQGSPLPGATVVVSSPNLQGTRTTVTGENGGYLFAALPPGDYTVRFEMEGMSPVNQSTRVSVATTSRVDARLAISEVAEAITVTAAAPAVVETTEVATNITAKTVDELPTLRTIGATALLAPGVQTAFGRSNQLNISGGPGYDNLILVNGVVVNENLRSQIHNLFIEDAIQETTVLQGGISAEYGRFTGGVVSTLTKSGGNEFSGSLRDSLSNPSWTAKTPWPDQADNVDELSEVYEATLGGYIVRDRLWFFAAGRSVEAATQYFTTITNLPFTTGTSETRLEGKLTARLAQNHNVVASYLDLANETSNTWFLSFGDGSPAVYDLRSLYNQEQPNTLATVQYNGVITQNLLLEASYAQKDFSFVGSGAPSRDRIEGTLLVDTSNGNRRYWSPTFCGVCGNEERNNNSWIAKSTYYLNARSLGSHTIVAGVENFAETRFVNNHQSGSDFRILAGTVRDAANEVVIGAHGGPYPIFAPGAIIQWNPILFPSIGSDLQTRSLFLNDRIDLNKNFSFNVGVRYDQNDATDSFGNVVSDDSAFSPRLGATWDVFGNGRSRANVTWGRYVSKIMDGNVGGAASPAGNPASITFFYRGPAINVDGPDLDPAQALAALWSAFDAAFAGLTTDNYLDHPWFRSATIPGASTQFDRSIASPSMDEITIGYGTSFAGSAYVRGDYIMRNWKNFYQNLLTLDTGRTADGRGDRSLMRNTDELEREYRGLHVQAGWRPSRYNVGGSYTYATLRGNDASEASATATSPNTTLQGWYPEYLGYERRMPVGSLDGDIRHRLKAWGGVNFGIGAAGRVNVSVLHTYVSGAAFGALGTIDASGITTPFEGRPVNPGYAVTSAGIPSRLGDQHDFWFTDRDAFRTEAFNSTDVALNYRLPLWQMEFFAQADLLNVFNDAAVISPSVTIQTRRSAGASSGLSAFNPFTASTIECPQGAEAAECAALGAHWQKGPQFGQPTGPSSYQDPRTYRFSVGLRF